MMPASRPISLLVTLLLAAAAWVADVRAGELKSAAPEEDREAVLHNPDMGWVLYENYPIDSAANGSSTMVTMPNEDFAGVDEVALMFSWFDIERTQGAYDFASVDRAYDHWRKRGKRIQLRMSTETLLWWDDATPPSGKGPPDYLVAKLSADKKQRRESKGMPAYTVVDASDPFYLERLEHFLQAVAKHYDDARPVTLIDLRGFGVWGEWHSGFRYPTLDQRRAALIGIIDRYAKSFPKHYLAMSYSYDPDGPKELYAGPYNRYDEASTQSFEQYLRYSAFDHALTKPNIAFRRDGCGGAVHSNERKLCDQAFATLAKGPFMSEFMDGYAQSKKGGDAWVRWKVEDALSLHPNYINLLGYQSGDALAFMRERKDLFDQGLREMGYRLVPTKIAYPDSIGPTQSFELESDWINRGVGRAMTNFSLSLVLADAKGRVVATSSASPALPTTKWIKGQGYHAKVSATFDDVPAGEYDLRIALFDPRSKQPIELPLKHRAADGSYSVGGIRVTGATNR